MCRVREKKRGIRKLRHLRPTVKLHALTEGRFVDRSVGLGKEMSSTDFSQLFLLKIAGIYSVFVRPFFHGEN